MFKTFKVYSGVVFLLTLAGNLVLAQPLPTNEWVNFLSSNTTLDGSPVPVGAVVNAYDPDGVWCGTFTVHTTGEYGFLIVYRDDVSTTAVDEGASPGDTITFYINGHLALPLDPDAPVWTANGDIIQLNLEGHSNYDPIITSAADTTATEDQFYSYTVTATDIDGDTLTYSLTTQPSWLSIDSATGVISGIPTNDDTGDTVVSVSVADVHGGQDTHTYTLHVLNTNDPPVISGFPDSVVFRSDSAVTLNLNDYVTDVDDPDSTLHWLVSGNNSVIVTINDILNVAVLSSPLSWTGFETLIFNVTDDSSAGDSDTLLVHVTASLGVNSEQGFDIPIFYSLSQNYPNPFNPVTRFRYQIPETVHVSLNVFNVFGQQVRTLVDARREAGYYSVYWDGRNDKGEKLTSGVYFSRIKAGKFTKTRKMIILR